MDWQVVLMCLGVCVCVYTYVTTIKEAMNLKKRKGTTWEDLVRENDVINYNLENYLLKHKHKSSFSCYTYSSC